MLPLEYSRNIINIAENQSHQDQAKQVKFEGEQNECGKQQVFKRFNEIDKIVKATQTQNHFQKPIQTNILFKIAQLAAIL